MARTSVTHQVTGLKELQKALTQLPERLVSNKGGPVKTSLMSAALPVMRAAQNTVPNRDSVANSGRLMQAVKRKRVTKTRSGQKNTEAVIVYVRQGADREDSTGAFYAPFVEFGAKGLSPTEWFRSALEDNQEIALDTFRKALAGHVQRIARKIGNENLAKVGADAKKHTAITKT